MTSFLPAAQDGFAVIRNGEVWLKNVHVSPHGTTGEYFNHEPRRERKLLMHKSEIRKFDQQIKIKKLTLVPLKVGRSRRSLFAPFFTLTPTFSGTLCHRRRKAYFNEQNKLKLNMALGQGKNQRDKRADIKEREGKRDDRRNIKRLMNS